MARQHAVRISRESGLKPISKGRAYTLSTGVSPGSGWTALFS